MKRFPSRFLCLLVTLLVFNSTFAQTQENSADAEKEKARREQEKQQELEKKAIAMLGEIADATDSLRLSVNRASIYAAVGVLLWKYDEKQARNAIGGAAQEIVNAQNAEDEEEGVSLGYQPAEWEMQEMRRQLVQSLAPLDAEFALEIFRRTRSPEIAALMQSPKNLFPNGNDYNRVQNEINTEQSLVGEIARQDPKRALKLAREILEKGVSYSALELIERVKDKEPEEASRLADDVARKLLETDFSFNYNERNVALNFLTRFAPKPAANSDEKSKFAVGESGLRALAEKLANFFLRDTQAENYYYQISQFIPSVEKLLPARAEQLRRRENEIKQKQARNNPYERLNRLNENADAETLIAEAENAPSEVKSQYYSYAASKLINVENPNFERARAVINSIPDRRTRDYALQNLNSQIFYKAVNLGNVDEARRIIAQTKNKNTQVSFYIYLFHRLRQKKDEKLARQMLDEAAALVASIPENREQMSAIFQLANAYAIVAPERSLGLIEPAVARFNELLNASVLINRFSGNYPIRADEITTQFFQNTLSQYGFYLSPSELAKMAAADFERAKSLADGFQRPEARVFARLLIAQAILSQTGNKTGVVTSLPITNRRFLSLKR